MLKWLYIGLGTVSVFTGIITFWLPIPIGLPLIFIGLPLLMKHSPLVNRWVHEMGTVYPRIGRLLKRLRLKEEKDRL